MPSVFQLQTHEFADENDGMWFPQLSGQRMENSVMLDWYKPRGYTYEYNSPSFCKS